MIKNFNFTPIPQIIFGCDKLSELPKVLTNYTNILLITGGNPLKIHLITKHY